VVIAAFHETGAARFFAEPLHELFGKTLALDELIPRAAVERVHQRIAAAPDHPHRIAIFEQFLVARLRPAAPDPVATAAVAAIRRTRGAVRIAQLARELGISQDPLEKRFRRAIGTSPKHLASLVRLRQVIDRQRAGVNWSRIAVEAGYFDQSHFIRAFRAIAGAAPERFFRDGTYC
jgi:transcriptional regulator GlxA family with amidase domain